MLIAFFVNAMEDEYKGYTTTLLAHEASRRGHDVCYITPEDFVFGADDPRAGATGSQYRAVTRSVSVSPPWSA